MVRESSSSKIEPAEMIEEHGRKTDIRGTKEDGRLFAHADSDRPTGGDGGSDGVAESERGDRTVCEGAAVTRPTRPRPVTHGKNTRHLIRSVQSRMARNLRKIAQLEQEILELREENAWGEEELASLQKTLEEWEERVANLKVMSTESEVESFDPAEELTA